MTTKLFLIIYLIPLGIFHAVASLAIATDANFNVDLGAAWLLAVPIFFVPLIHLFMSTSRMQEEAQTVVVEELGGLATDEELLG